MYHKVRPVMVFDGGSLPMKAETNEERRRKRMESLAQGKALLEAGNAAAAEQCFRKATSVSWEMMRRFQAYLTREGVEWIVAPYEADAQLAFLSRNGWVDAIVTEDSDLLAFGCAVVLYKLDKTGQCKQVRFADLGSIVKPAMANFDLDMFRTMCILSGCDYVKQIPGVGLVKAHELVVRHRTLEGVLAALRSDKKKTVPDGYEDRVRLAELTFRHQRVWDHEHNGVTTLTPMPADCFAGDAPENDCLGPKLEAETAYGVASGHLNPHTHQPYDAAAEAVKKGPASGLVKTPSNTIDRFFAVQPRTRLTKSSSAPALPRPQQRQTPQQQAHAMTLAKLEEFRQKQEQDDRVLAPATPEKGASGRKPLLGGLLEVRQRRDNTPQPLQATPGKPLVVSPFFQTDGKEASPRRSLIADFDEEVDYDAEEEALLIEEAAAVAATTPVLSAPSYVSPLVTAERVSLRPAARDVVAGLLASAKMGSAARASLKLQSLSRRNSQPSHPTEEEEDKQERQEEDDDEEAAEARPSKTSKMDFSQWGYKRRPPASGSSPV